MKLNKEHIRYIVVAMFVVVLVASSAYLWSARYSLSSDASYQAVFLTNGQIYFGKLSNKNKEWITLSDVFYLQKRQVLDGEITNIPDLNLVKLGSELHGPENQMEINREHILFIEQLSSDSQIITAIEQLPN